jgi:hypothetical protein
MSSGLHFSVPEEIVGCRLSFAAVREVVDLS